MSDIQDELDRLEREDPAVRAASASLDAVVEYLSGRLPSPVVKAIYDLTAEPSWVFVVPAERPYETTLSDDCEPGDLG